MGNALIATTPGLCCLHNDSLCHHLSSKALIDTTMSERNGLRFLVSFGRGILRLLLTTALICDAVEGAFMFARQPNNALPKQYRNPSETRLPSMSLRSKLSDQDDIPEGGESTSDEPVVQSVVRVDDHGSDLTNRFKCKVNALMGTFDPKSGEDDERQEGNILNGELTVVLLYALSKLEYTRKSSICLMVNFSM